MGYAHIGQIIKELNKIGTAIFAKNALEYLKGSDYCHHVGGCSSDEVWIVASRVLKEKRIPSIKNPVGPTQFSLVKGG
jgi:hypothetical protein